MNALPLIAAQSGGQALIAGMILLIAVAFVVVVWAMASRYKKIPPNQVGIFYGRKYKYIDAEREDAASGLSRRRRGRLAAVADHRAVSADVHRRSPRSRSTSTTSPTRTT